jgi:hypothetical protein
MRICCARIKLILQMRKEREHARYREASEVLPTEDIEPKALKAV